MRFTIAALTLAAAAPLSAQQYDPLAFLRKEAVTVDRSFQTLQHIPYRPIRNGEVRTAGFLTEMRVMPFGRVLGPVTPPVVHVADASVTVYPGTVIGVQPPMGAAYQRGDTIVLARVLTGPPGWGDIIIPTGIAKVGDHTPRQTLATVIALFGEIAVGQVSYPLEPLTNPGTVQPVPASGPSGEIIAGSQVRELEQVGGMMFITIGSGAGLRIGDFVEVRRRVFSRLNAADTIDELMATAQVVRVGEKSSTIRLIRVLDGNIPAGAPVVRIATLPT